MPETIALLRLTISKNRYLLAFMIAALTIGQLTFLFTVPEDLHGGETAWAIGAILYTLMPAAGATILLFDYGSESDLALPESGCNHWLLRMPIATWKIAIIPVVLKTAWISLLWLLMVVFLRQMDTGDAVPIVAPCLSFSAAMIWLLVISWRPFRRGWHRVVALVIAVPILYVNIVASIGAPFLDRVEWRPQATLASQVAAVTIYAAAVGMTIRAVHLARTSAAGIFSPKFVVKAEVIGRRRVTRERRFAGVWPALLHKDWIERRDRIRNIFLIAVIPTIIGMVGFAPLHAVSVVYSFGIFAMFGGMAATQSVGSGDGTSRLSPYLAAAPIRTSTLAWSKLVSTLGIMLGMYSLISFVMIGWALWPQNVQTWMAWSSNLAVMADQPSQTIPVGIRSSAAIVIAVTVLMFGRVAAYHWIGMTGRTWVVLLVSFLMIVGMSIPIGVFLRWFMQQTDWESTRESALRYLQWAPSIVVVALMAKGLLTIAAAVALRRIDLVSTATLFKAIAIWTGIAGSVSIILWLLIVDPRATLWWCLSLTALTIPLARILALPIALAWNRHR